jgi:predicted DNA-binding protein (UPF0251 family)
MPRPKKMRCVGHTPDVTFFKPQGVPLRLLDKVFLEMDELEALRLADFEALSHEQAAERMQISRATFGRIVEQGRKKTADALIHGKAICIRQEIVSEFAGTSMSGHGRERGCGYGRRGRGGKMFMPFMEEET